jgi:hypothetical protein
LAGWLVAVAAVMNSTDCGGGIARRFKTFDTIAAARLRRD